MGKSKSKPSKYDEVIKLPTSFGKAMDKLAKPTAKTKRKK
jgi:hypothetical protein